MSGNALEFFANAVAKDWGPLSTKVVTAIRGHMEMLLQAPQTESWLEDLKRNAPPSQELVRDAQFGFILQAHTEAQGLYRPPHDHGRSWVIYAVQAGEVEMCTYGRIVAADGSVRLVKRDSIIVQPGQVRVYLPGDIHDTQCVAGPALLYRFTERDLKIEDRVERRITRYAERNGAWVAP